jgi:hypothetical protein
MTKKISLALCAVATAFMMNACSSTPKPLYEYGDYSDAYYASKKSPTEESMLELQKSMQDAIEKSDQSRSGRVAPGMYANLGYLYLKANKSAEAIASFEKEKALYPESAHFMDRMIKKVQVAQGASK